MTLATQTLNRERIYKVVQCRVADEPTVHMPVAPHMDPRIKVCLERAELITESYRQTEDEPWILRRAKAVDHLLRNMTIYILDGEQIVGNYASTPAESRHLFSFHICLSFPRSLLSYKCPAITL